MRYECEHCNDCTTTTEKYDWAADGGKITRGLEKYILRCVIFSKIQDIARKERLSYRIVERIIENHVPAEID
ncbi:transposase family protein [Cysteiniphilum halobium]|uniref:transposase family protein n=1 Tax=Cysteiniphilum halobium TaxID=2219059 RepID=UPI003F842B3B